MAQLLSSNISGNLNVTSVVFTANLMTGVNVTANFNQGGAYVFFAGQNANTFGSLAVQNFSSNVNASADLILINDVGNDNVGAIDIGINSSKAADPAFPTLLANDGYIIVTAVGTATANLMLQAGSANSNINFFVGGQANSNLIMSLQGVPGSVVGVCKVNGNISVGNVTVTQNVTEGNLTVITLANIATLNAVTALCNAVTISSNTLTGNLSVTQNTTTGNLVVSTLANIVTLNAVTALHSTANIATTLNVATLISAANITMNGTSFIPAWTAATLNASYTALAGFNPPSFWQDPFGIVHIRGVLKPAANLSFSSILNVNIANGFPTTSNASRFIASAANDTVLGTNTAAYITWNICSNGAAQITLEQTIITGNLVYVSMDGIIYSKIGG